MNPHTHSDTVSHRDLTSPSLRSCDNEGGYQHQRSLDKDIENVKDVYTEFENFDFEHNQNFQNGWSSLSNIVDPSKIGIEYLKAKVFFFSKYHKTINLEKYISWKKEISDSSKRMTHAASRDQDIKQEGQESIQQGNHQHSDDNIANDNAINRPLCQSNNAVISNQVDDCVKIHSANNDTCSKSPNVFNCDSISTLLHSTSLDEDTRCRSTEKITDRDVNEESISLVEEKKENSDISSSESALKEDGNESSLTLLEVASYIQNGLPIPGLVSLEVQPTNEDATPSSRERKLKPWELHVTETVNN